MKQLVLTQIYYNHINNTASKRETGGLSGSLGKVSLISLT